MNPQVKYKLLLLNESIQVSGQLLLIRMHLKTVTEYEFARLNKRAEYIRECIKEV